MPSFPWRVTSAVACVFASCVLLGAEADQQGLRLDQILAAYAGGDHDVVARSFARTGDFPKYNLFDRRRVERWLGAWSPDKAALLAEIVERSASLSPQYVPNLVVTGQEYLLSRPLQPGASPKDDDLERRWHLIAIAA